MTEEMIGLKGYHILADLWGCPSIYLDDISTLEEILLNAARKVGFNVVGKSFYQFKPKGATGVVLLEFSHISVHTWPEYEFIALDIYSCKGKTKVKRATEYLLKTLQPKKVTLHEVERFK